MLFPKDKYNINTFYYDFSESNINTEEVVFEVHLFIFLLDKDPHHIIEFIKKLQNNKKYSNYPMVLFSKNKKYLYDAFFELKPFRSVLFPLNQKSIFNLAEYIEFYYNMYQSSLKTILQLTACSHCYRIKIDNILFIEAKNRKISIYTKDNNVIEFPITFHKMLELIPENTLIQCHRSYIINPNNVSRIDREAKHWIASFYNTNKKAFISRPYKQKAFDMAYKNIMQPQIYPMIDRYYFQ